MQGFSKQKKLWRGDLNNAATIVVSQCGEFERQGCVASQLEARNVVGVKYPQSLIASGAKLTERWTLNDDSSHWDVFFDKRAIKGNLWVVCVGSLCSFTRI